MKKRLFSLATGRELRALLQNGLFGLWLKKSVKGFLSMAVHVLFMVYLLGPTVRFFFPPKTIHFLGVIEIRPKGPETWEKIVQFLDPILWILGLSLFLAYLESRIEPTLSEAGQRDKEGMNAA